MTIYIVASTNDCGCSKMLNRGLSHAFFLSLFKLVPCPIYWIVCVFAYSNFKFWFQSNFDTAQNSLLCPDTVKYKFHLNCLEHSICILCMQRQFDRKTLSQHMNLIFDRDPSAILERLFFPANLFFPISIIYVPFFI